MLPNDRHLSPSLYWCDKAPWPWSPLKESFIWLGGFRELRSMIAEWRISREITSWSTAWSREGTSIESFEISECPPSSTPSPTRPHLLHLPKKFHQLGSKRSNICSRRHFHANHPRVNQSVVFLQNVDLYKQLVKCWLEILLFINELSNKNPIENTFLYYSIF